MIELTLANRVLVQVIDNDINFKKSLKNVLNVETRKYSAIVSALAGCELRHHLLFEKLLKSFDVELTNEEQHLVSLGLANAYFIKKLPNEKVIEYVKDCLKDKFVKKIEDAFFFDGSISDILGLDKNTLDYVSIRFNTPSWLIKMWNKHFGVSNSFKILKANTQPGKIYVRVNPFVDKHPSLFDTNIFEPTDVQDVYLYKGNQPFKKTEACLSNCVFAINKEIVRLFDKYLDPMTNEYCMYSYSDDSLVEEIIARSKKEKGIYLAVPDYFARPKIFGRIKSKELRNISMFSYKDKFSLQANISRKQELIIVNPISSSFDKARMYPDYLLHFKQESMDQILKAQRNALEELKEYLVHSGMFIYIVDTMNKKEGTLLIRSFLEAHKDMELVEEKQYLTGDESDCGMYYAVMKMKINEND